jgi:hypothetical protein
LPQTLAPPAAERNPDHGRIQGRAFVLTLLVELQAILERGSDAGTNRVVQALKL